MAAFLAMIHVGAKGRTASQIKDSLQMSSFPDEQMYPAFESLIRGLKVIPYISTICSVQTNVYQFQIS